MATETPRIAVRASSESRPAIDEQQYAELGINPGSVQKALASLFKIAQTNTNDRPAPTQQIVVKHDFSNSEDDLLALSKSSLKSTSQENDTKDNDKSKTSRLKWNDEVQTIGVARPVDYTYADCETQTRDVFITMPQEIDEEEKNVETQERTTKPKSEQTKVETSDPMIETESRTNFRFPRAKRINVLIAGKKFIGKSSLIKTLLNNKKNVRYTSLVSQAVLSQYDLYEKDDEEKKKIIVSLIDMPDNDDDSLSTTIRYINTQFSSRLISEFKSVFSQSGPMENKEEKSSCVHVCLYLLHFDANGEIDADDQKCIKELYTKVPIVPIIAKADSVSESDIQQRRKKISETLAGMIYEFPYLKEKSGIPLALANTQDTFAFQGRKSTFTGASRLLDGLLCGHVDHFVHLLNTESYETYRKKSSSLLARKLEAELKRLMHQKIDKVARDMHHISQAAQETEHNRERLEQLRKQIAEIHEADTQRKNSQISLEDGSDGSSVSESESAGGTVGLRSFAKYKTRSTGGSPAPSNGPSTTTENAEANKVEGGTVRRNTDTEMAKQLLKAKYNTLGTKNRRRPTPQFD